MEIVVNDANLFFDLLNADLIDVFFELPFDVCTTDFVISEITDHDYNQMNVNGGLKDGQ